MVSGMGVRTRVQWSFGIEVSLLDGSQKFGRSLSSAETELFLGCLLVAFQDFAFLGFIVFQRLSLKV